MSPKYRIPPSASKRAAWDPATDSPWKSNQAIFTWVRSSDILGQPGSRWLIINRVAVFVFLDNHVKQGNLQEVNVFQIGDYCV